MAKEEAINKKLDSLLLNYERANQDKWNLSKALDNRVEVTIDVNSLKPVQERNAHGLSPTELEMAPEQYLKLERCRAEANLIKARIAYKVHSDLTLSAIETTYL